MPGEKMPQHMTTSYDRFWLRLTRTLPVNEIGSEVSLSVMEKAMDRRRVGFNIGMILFASFGAFLYGRQFSKDRKRQSQSLEDKHFK